MNHADVITLLIGYTIFCLGVFCLAMWTCYEEQVAVDARHILIIAGMLCYAFCPILNLVMLVNTIRYRKGKL